ncbi:hypothetical protein NDN08_000086 [Rhodosorus marinus]|uniref:Uncharacterized protein n=1 Tax=Rhodosorus marinus TaxID=101924 RepID=A0AAV8UE77_9RHOD|nr:hypothetical protein NDN08_000086 [Rhodosorus marinus]
MKRSREDILQLNVVECLRSRREVQAGSSVCMSSGRGRAVAASLVKSLSRCEVSTSSLSRVTGGGGFLLCPSVLLALVKSRLLHSKDLAILLENGRLLKLCRCENGSRDLVLELSSFEFEDHARVLASLLIALDPEAATSITTQMKDTPATSKTCAIVLDHLLTNSPQSNAVELALAAEATELVPKKVAGYIQILREKCGDAAAGSACTSLLNGIVSGRLDRINIPACAHLARLLLRDKSNSTLRSFHELLCFPENSGRDENEFSLVTAFVRLAMGVAGYSKCLRNFLLSSPPFRIRAMAKLLVRWIPHEHISWTAATATVMNNTPRHREILEMYIIESTKRLSIGEDMESQRRTDSELQTLAEVFGKDEEQAVERINRLRFFRRSYFQAEFVPRLLQLELFSSAQLEKTRVNVIKLLGDRKLIDGNAATLAAADIENRLNRGGAKTSACEFATTLKLRILGEDLPVAVWTLINALAGRLLPNVSRVPRENLASGILVCATNESPSWVPEFLQVVLGDDSCIDVRKALRNELVHLKSSSDSCSFDPRRFAQAILLFYGMESGMSEFREPVGPEDEDFSESVFARNSIKSPEERAYLINFSVDYLFIVEALNRARPSETRIRPPKALAALLVWYTDMRVRDGEEKVLFSTEVEKSVQQLASANNVDFKRWLSHEVRSGLPDVRKCGQIILEMQRKCVEADAVASVLDLVVLYSRESHSINCDVHGLVLGLLSVEKDLQFLDQERNSAVSVLLEAIGLTLSKYPTKQAVTVLLEVLSLFSPAIVLGTREPFDTALCLFSPWLKILELPPWPESVYRCLLNLEGACTAPPHLPVFVWAHVAQAFDRRLPSNKKSESWSVAAIVDQKAAGDVEWGASWTFPSWLVDGLSLVLHAQRRRCVLDQLTDELRCLGRSEGSRRTEIVRMLDCMLRLSNIISAQEMASENDLDLLYAFAAVRFTYYTDVTFPDIVALDKPAVFNLYNSVLEYATELADRRVVQWSLLSSCGYLSGSGRRSFQSLLGHSASIDKFFAALLSIYTGDRAVSIRVRKGLEIAVLELSQFFEDEVYSGTESIRPFNPTLSDMLIQRIT